MRLMVYSHDTFGLGNIRRMLAICEDLLETIAGLSILLVSGSPMLHSFRLPKGLDYIKIPCLGRDARGQLSVKYLETEMAEALQLRSELIKAAVANFKPDLVLVDKKPYGLQGELKDSIRYLKKNLPQTKLVLLLRDILDTPEVTIEEWKKSGYTQAVEQLYDQVLVVGMPEIFNLAQEYCFSPHLAHKVRFCGYIRRKPGKKSRQTIRQELQIKADEKLVLVTPGGGGDGYRLVQTYLEGLKYLPTSEKVKSLMICGPEMPSIQREELSQIAQNYSTVKIDEFTDDIMSYMEAADLVVCMSGYNTICEILSLSKPAVVVPRVQPVKEQWIRAKRMANLGLFKVIEPEDLTPPNLIKVITEELRQDPQDLSQQFAINLNALPRIQSAVYSLFYAEKKSSFFEVKKNSTEICYFPNLEAVS